jgi:hypothetical protein
MRITIIVFALTCLGSVLSHAQGPSPAMRDTAGYAPSADSVRALDSAYRARKALLDKWVQTQTATAHPQEDFISAYIGYGGFLQILPRDLNQLFSERTLRPASDLTSDRNEYDGVDRAVIVAVQAQLDRTWGIYFEYDLVEKWFNTSIDSAAPAPYNISGATEELDLTEHSFVVGGMVVLYSGEFYRLRAVGGFGGVIALTSETESPGKYARTASAAGYQVNFDLLNDFRVAQGVSFTIDLLTRSVTTGEFKTSSGQTLDAPFGAGDPSRITIKPTGSNLVYGIAAGLVIYF